MLGVKITFCRVDLSGARVKGKEEGFEGSRDGVKDSARGGRWMRVTWLYLYKGRCADIEKQTCYKCLYHT